jgi:Subtilase family
MSDIYWKFVLFALAILIAACAAPVTPLPPTASPAPSSNPVPMPPVSIARYPAPLDFSEDYLELTSIPKFDSNSTDPWQIDLRSRDLTKIDMTASLSDLMYAVFDSKTQWPPADKLPAAFDWRKIMELGKDPGLGVSNLHQQGINGTGIGIGMIDQPLLVDHQEYKNRLRLYEEINISPDTQARLHGGAVASIAVGKTVGVAPAADLYYIGAWPGDWDPETHEVTSNFKYYAQAVHRILEINRSLPEDRKIRVIAMQVGWSSGREGYVEITDAVEQAKAEGIFVISSSLGPTYNLYFHGMGRDPREAPNRFESYIPGIWWEKDFYASTISNSYPWDLPKGTLLLLVPMDSRTTASPTGTEDYAFYRQGGWSWSIPYLAGMYALAAQVKPDITPELFWETALNTGRTIQIQHDRKEFEFGIILDPQALIEAIKSK